jgi:hypothetical protein
MGKKRTLNIPQSRVIPALFTKSKDSNPKMKNDMMQQSILLLKEGILNLVRDR